VNVIVVVVENRMKDEKGNQLNKIEKRIQNVVAILLNQDISKQSRDVRLILNKEDSNHTFFYYSLFFVVVGAILGVFISNKQWLPLGIGFLIVLGFLVYKEWRHKTRQKNLEECLRNIEKIRKVSENHVNITS